jgi:tetratricopeptide (TPR) repeat protein
VRKLAGSFLFECHDAIRNLPGSTAARKLIAKRALDYLDALAREQGDDAALRRELAIAYQKVGDVLGNPYQPNVGDMAGARASYATAIGLLEPVVASGQGSDEDRALLATALLIGGGIDLVAGDREQAIARSAEGLALRQELAKRAGDRARRIDLATAWQYHAYNLATAGRDDEARAAIDRQAALLEELRAEPGRQDDPAVERGRGQNRYLLARHLQGRKDVAGARAAYDEAIAIQRALAAGDPTNTAYVRDLSWTLNDEAIFVRSTGDLPGAIAIYRDVLGRCEALARADSQSVDATIGLARAHHNLASALRGAGELDEALSHARAALALCEPVVAADPVNAFAKRMRARACLNVAEIQAARGDPVALDEAAELYERGRAIFEEEVAAGRDAGDCARWIEEARIGLAEVEQRRAALSGSRR